MTTLFQRARGRRPAGGDLRSWDDLVGLLSSFSYGGQAYPLQQTLGATGAEERVGDGFVAFVQAALKRNGVVFACELTRMTLFAEARFQFRQRRGGRPGDLFGNGDLSLLERPWPNATTGDLLSRLLLHADFAGNGFVAKRPTRLRIMRPDWVTIIHGSENDPDPYDLDAELLGYMYKPGGPTSPSKPVLLLPEEVGHFAPLPDPVFQHRGMSWLTPVLQEIDADSAANTHKLRFFENGATSNLVVSVDASVSVEKFKQFVALMEAGHAGLANAYKTIYLGGGADAKVVGSDFRQMDFKVTQGAGESRIAAAAGVHPVVVGLSEGLQGSSLNAGNFTAARRIVADKTLRPLWRNVAGSLSSIIPPPIGAELWYDDRDVPFLREDRKDVAEIQTAKATTIGRLIDAGYDPDSVIQAVEAEDYALLVGQHSGLYSVQLQPPSTGQPADDEPHDEPHAE